MFSWFTLDRLDRYALRLIAGPMALSLLALLVAQLLERLLRLFDLAASAGAGPASVVLMASTLVPHYLGLALPMAFTAAIFMAVAHLCDDNELDVMLMAGRSIGRIAAPYFMLSLMLSVFSLYLYGQLQPLARYGYHVAVNQVLQTGWDARVEENHFTDIGHGMTFTADVIEADGRRVHGVFMHRRSGGKESVLTAAHGRIVPTPEGLQLQLEDGRVVHLRDDPGTGGEAITISRFTHGVTDHDFSPKPPPLAARGANVRELTQAELWRDMHLDGGQGKPAAEFHSRLARSMIFPFLLLLALPLGMASKRGRRAPGVVFGVLALLAIDHAIQFGQGLGGTERVPAALAIWAPFAIFALLSLWIFRSSLAWPGDNPVLRAVMGVEGLVDRVRVRTAKHSGARSAA